MDIFTVLTLWVYGLAVLFCLHAVVAAACKAIYEVTGATVSDHAYNAYTWVIANPVWAWRIADLVAPDHSVKRSYFDF